MSCPPGMNPHEASDFCSTQVQPKWELYTTDALLESAMDNTDTIVRLYMYAKLREKGQSQCYFFQRVIIFMTGRNHYYSL
jgi:hypothetical protein